MKCCIIGCINHSGANKTISYHQFPHPIKDRYRYAKWIEACNNPRMEDKTPQEILRQFRVCRRHFEDHCFNGGCKRLLPSSIPSLHLNKNAGFLLLLNGESSDSIFEQQKHNEFTLHRDELRMNIMPEDKIMTIADAYDDEDDDDYRLEVDSKDEPLPTTIIEEYVEVEPVEEELILENEEEIMDAADEYFEELCTETEEPLDSIVNSELETEQIFLDTDEEIDRQTLSSSISTTDLNEWKTKFYDNPKNVLAQNACTKSDPFEVCLSRKAQEHTNHSFNHKIDAEGKPVTDQKSSGRCWLFAILNCVRVPFAKQLNLEEFEFSQAYLFYWDKIERCNFILNTIAETLQRGEKVDGRLISFLLSNPTNDGGQWDMIFNLVKKYGVMPKKCFPDTFSCEASRRMNQILRSKLREYTKVLNDMIQESASPTELQAKIKEQMNQIYNVVGICLSIPDEQFTWEYYDKSKTYHKIGPITPLDFYEQHVKNVFNFDDKVCIINDPRPSNPFNELYTLDCLGNVVGGRMVKYNNQPIEILMRLVIDSIKKGEPVWFGSDFGKRISVKLSALDPKAHDFEVTFGVDIEGPLNKADRLIYGESCMTHAMVFTAVMCDENGDPKKFRVENSWGEKGEKGYYVMSTEWFKEFVYEIVVDKSFVDPSILAVFDKTPVVLPAWDPMGTLANE